MTIAEYRAYIIELMDTTLEKHKIHPTTEAKANFLEGLLEGLLNEDETNEVAKCDSAIAGILQDIRNGSFL
jgi:hypothetical protein